MNKIREKREDLGLTIVELSEKINVHFTTVSEWELEKTIPRPKHRIGLSEVLNCPREELFPELYPHSKENVPKATHEGVLTIGDKKINCAVLGDGTRVLTRKAVFISFNRPQRGKISSGNRVINMPSFLDANNLQPFVSNELMGMINPITYIDKKGKIATGYNAIIIPLTCDAYLSARADNKLIKKQLPLAAYCEILVRSLSKTGIIALVDEATGYQEVRDKLALQEILNKFIAKELQPYVKTFPLEFYKEIYRLRDWDYPPTKSGWNPVVGHYTNNFVYARIAPGVLEELRKMNPKDEKGRRKARLFQGLTPDIGHPKLVEHISNVMVLMRASTSFDTFGRLIDRALPKYDGRMKQLGFDLDTERL